MAAVVSADCRDVSEMGNITLELVRRGYTEDQIRKIWGGNFLRVFREVERWAKRNSLKDKIDWHPTNVEHANSL